MKKAIFTMGAPAAGKSTYIAQQFLDTQIIDPDQIKKNLANYDPKSNDDETRDFVHLQSKNIADAQFATALVDGASFILDGTGTNFAPLIAKIRTAKLAGFETELIYVTCTLAESIKRNAKRERFVPEQIIREKFDGIEIAFECVAKEVDTVRVIDNSTPIQRA